mmetsp:Transcript_85860/g.228896  ORF Transcript_85860/g.228896 Transcript_85860/m.228896 type:complete len:258 (-) Transcript_85860:236-1009(-)
MRSTPPRTKLLGWPAELLHRLRSMAPLSLECSHPCLVDVFLHPPHPPPTKNIPYPSLCHQPRLPIPRPSRLAELRQGRDLAPGPGQELREPLAAERHQRRHLNSASPLHLAARRLHVSAAKVQQQLAGSVGGVRGGSRCVLHRRELVFPKHLSAHEVGGVGEHIEDELLQLHAVVGGGSRCVALLVHRGDLLARKVVGHREARGEGKEIHRVVVVADVTGVEPKLAWSVSKCSTRGTICDDPCAVFTGVSVQTSLHY